MKNLDLSLFPAIDKNQWLQLAEKQLKGSDPNEELSWSNDAGLELNGYYDQSDLNDLKYLEDFFSNTPPHNWKLYERIGTDNAKKANEHALEALMGGCNGIILENPNEADLSTILNNVDTKICDVSIVSDSTFNLPEKYTGFLIMDNGNCFSSDEKENPVHQLSQILGNLTEEKFVHRLAFADFFLEIATVRCLRYLASKKGFEDIQIHTQIPLHFKEDHQWFLNTTAGLASILGGSHSLDFSTATGDARISRNTGNLIREESGIISYNDQLGGSYYIETLTDKIISKVSEKLNS